MWQGRKIRPMDTWEIIGIVMLLAAIAVLFA